MALKKIHTITHKALTGRDAFGAGSYGAETTFNARYNNEVKSFTTDRGVELVSVGTIYYDPADKAIAVGDMVKHTGEFTEVRAIAEYPNASGTKQINVAYLTASVR